jgi:RNA polymerase sigma-70 factor, ECF subfamily
MNDLTLVLERIGEDADAARDLLPVLYEELHALARKQFGGQRIGHTLQPTVLVHEAFLKLLGNPVNTYTDRRHFFAVAAIVMRQILINHARGRAAEKRGGGSSNVALDENSVSVDGQERIDVLDLHDALQDLLQIDERKHKVVELRFFAGLTVPEVAEVMGLSVTTIESEWRAARAWLMTRLDPVR